MGSLPHVVEDCLGILKVYSDGSIWRLSDDQIDFDNFPVKDDGSVVWKDILYDGDGEEKLYLRLYKPIKCIRNQKLPIIYFFHGGGFCVGSRTWRNCHNCCLRLSSVLEALVIAPDYRLAPDYRHPAAMDDAFTSMKWLQNEANLSKSSSDHHDSWISDYDRVYVIGDSSGGNMAHHLALRLGVGSPLLAPVRVRGYLLMAPFFGGSVRTKSEADGPAETFLNMEILDSPNSCCEYINNRSSSSIISGRTPSEKSTASLPSAFSSEIRKDKDEKYTGKCSSLGVEGIDFVVAFVTTKNWFYLMSQPKKCWNDEHVDVIFYYLRKKSKQQTNPQYRYMIANYFFKTYIDKASVVDNYEEKIVNIRV